MTIFDEETEMNKFKTEDVSLTVNGIEIKGIDIDIAKNKRIDIVFDAYYAKEHPQKTLKDLGVTYKKAIPQSMGDCWWFFGVENLPNELPSEIKIKDFGDLKRLIGRGLSKDDVDLLISTYA